MGQTSQVLIRDGQVGDLGWTFERQAVLYHDLHGYSPVFETYVAKGLPSFLEGFDPARDALRIAMVGGRRAGAVAVQHDPERPGWCKLRWFFVEPWARGRGLGKALLEDALAFGRRAGHTGMYLWTCDDLHDARRMYEKAGFRLVEETDSCPWKEGVREQRWELRLA